jgi:hypothetical protein
MLNEFTEEEINRNTCSDCQCKDCTNDACEYQCQSSIPCMAPTTTCSQATN